jgi:hypothetical protein
MPSSLLAHRPRFASVSSMVLLFSEMIAAASVLQFFALQPQCTVARR